MLNVALSIYEFADTQTHIHIDNRRRVRQLYFVVKQAERKALPVTTTTYSRGIKCVVLHLHTS
jgi:hypothetical protein